MKCYLLAVFALFTAGMASASSIVTNPTGFTSTILNPGSCSGGSFSDGNGDSVAIVNGRCFSSFILAGTTGSQTATITLKFASPVSAAGFDIDFTSGSGSNFITAILENGDDFTTPTQVPSSGFFGIQSTSSFSGIQFDIAQSCMAITDFRFAGAADSTTPEPATLALFAPAALIGFAALRLKRGSRS